VKRLTLGVAGLLALAVLGACGDDDSGAGDASEVGRVVVGHLSDGVRGDSAFVLVPTGRLDVTVGTAVDRVTADQAADGNEHRAPDGGSFVPVQWSFDPFGEGGARVPVIGANPEPTEVALVVGDTSVELGSPYKVTGEGITDTGVGTMYAAVDGAPDAVDDVQVSVSYDGLTQTVNPATGERDAGAAAPLYDKPSMGIEAPCTSEGFAHGRVRPEISCLVNAPTRVPYLPTHGWAEDGRTWLVVPLDIAIDSVDVGGTSYDVTSVEPRLTVDGGEPLADDRFGKAEPQPSAVRDTWAFDVASDGPQRLTISLDATLTKSDPEDPGPASHEVTLRQTVPLA
jgi:hypothetical protein